MNCLELSYMICGMKGFWWKPFCDNLWRFGKGFYTNQTIISANQTVWYGTELNYCLSESKNYLITVNATCVLWALINDWQLPS